MRELLASSNGLLRCIGGILLFLFILPSCSKESPYTIELSKLQDSAFREFKKRHPDVPFQAAFESYGIAFDDGDEIIHGNNKELIVKGLLTQREIIEAILDSISNRMDVVSMYEDDVRSSKWR